MSTAFIIFSWLLRLLFGRWFVVGKVAIIGRHKQHSSDQFLCQEKDIQRMCVRPGSTRSTRTNEQEKWCNYANGYPSML